MPTHHLECHAVGVSLGSWQFGGPIRPLQQNLKEIGGREFNHETVGFLPFYHFMDFQCSYPLVSSMSPCCLPWRERCQYIFPQGTEKRLKLVLEGWLNPPKLLTSEATHACAQWSPRASHKSIRQLLAFLRCRSPMVLVDYDRDFYCAYAVNLCLS